MTLTAPPTLHGTWQSHDTHSPTHYIAHDSHMTLTAPAPRSSSVLMVALFLASLLALMAANFSIGMVSLRERIWSVMAPPSFLASSFFTKRCCGGEHFAKWHQSWKIILENKAMLSLDFSWIYDPKNTVLTTATECAPAATNDTFQNSHGKCSTYLVCQDIFTLQRQRQR